MSLVWDSLRVLWHFSRLMYRVFSLFISYKHLYITNILHSCVYSYLLPLCDSCYCFRIDLLDIYLSTPLMYLLFVYLTFRFRMAISHRVDVLTQDRCVGFPHSNLLYHSYFRHSGTRSKPLYGWSLLNGLILRLGRRHF